MDEDPFETVAIAYSQAQAGVILSLFAWHGIPAYARNIEHARVNPPLTLALGGFPIRVYRAFAEEARGLLAEAAEREPEPVVEPLGERLARLPMLGLLLLFGAAPQPRLSAEIVR